MSIKKRVSGVVRALLIASYISSNVVNAQPVPLPVERRGPPPQALAVCVYVE